MICIDTCCNKCTKTLIFVTLTTTTTTKVRIVFCQTPSHHWLSSFHRLQQIPMQLGGGRNAQLAAILINRHQTHRSTTITLHLCDVRFVSVVILTSVILLAVVIVMHVSWKQYYACDLARILYRQHHQSLSAWFSAHILKQDISLSALVPTIIERATQSLSISS